MVTHHDFQAVNALKQHTNFSGSILVQQHEKKHSFMLITGMRTVLNASPIIEKRSTGLRRGVSGSQQLRFVCSLSEGS